MISYALFKAGNETSDEESKISAKVEGAWRSRTSRTASRLPDALTFPLEILPCPDLQPGHPLMLGNLVLRSRQPDASNEYSGCPVEAIELTSCRTCSM
jgi:hypothetical protein